MGVNIQRTMTPEQEERWVREQEILGGLPPRQCLVNAPPAEPWHAFPLGSPERLAALTAAKMAERRGDNDHA